MAPTATINAPVTTDANDPATIAANNMGSASVPGDMPAHIAALFAGTDFDPNATITKATLAYNTAGKGKSGKTLEQRDIAALTANLAKITSTEGEEEGSVFGH